MKLTPQTITPVELDKLVAWLMDPQMTVFLDLIESEEAKLIQDAGEHALALPNQVIGHQDVGPAAKECFAEAATRRIVAAYLRRKIQTREFTKYL